MPGSGIVPREYEACARSVQEPAARAFLDRFESVREVERHTDLVLAGALEEVEHGKDRAPLVESHGAHRGDRDGQASVAGVGCYQEVPLVVALPTPELGCRIEAQLPEEPWVETILLLAVDERRVVRGCRPKAVSPFGRSRVDEAARVGDDLGAGKPGFEGQAVVVPVSAAPGEPDRTAVDQDVCLRGPHDVHAGVGKTVRREVDARSVGEQGRAFRAAVPRDLGAWPRKARLQPVLAPDRRDQSGQVAMVAERL